MRNLLTTITVRHGIVHDVLLTCVLTYTCIMAFIAGFFIGRLLFGV